MCDVVLKDFYPINHWEVDREKPKNIIDWSTGRKYMNESEGIIRTKCFFVIFATPVVHCVACVVNVANRVAKLLIGFQFWVPRVGEESCSFKARLKEARKDLLLVLAQPLAFLGLELAAIYGLFRPLDGRKIYASIERVQYGGSVLTPCFQPKCCHK